MCDGMDEGRAVEVSLGGLGLILLNINSIQGGVSKKKNQRFVFKNHFRSRRKQPKVKPWKLKIGEELTALLESLEEGNRM